MTNTETTGATHRSAGPGIGPAVEVAATETESATGPLVPASVTADRERMRLRLTAGRRGPRRALALAVPALRHLGSAEAAQNGLRYRPVAWTFIAIVALAVHLPGRADRITTPQPVAAPSPVVTAAPDGVRPPDTTPEAAPAPDFAPVAPLPSFTPTPGSFTPSVAPTTPATLPSTDAGDGGDVAPLAVRGWGWASRLPTTPLPTDRVAEDTIPVANRLGGVDRLSFVRLSGDDDELVLVEDPDSAREALGPAAVAICPLLDDSWAEGPEQSFDDAPSWDPDACVGGSEDDDRWTFDLSRFDDRAGDHGFALVPTVDAPADFQVAFSVAEL